MRHIIDPQLQIGEEAIGAIWLDPKSRDDIPQILRGLQHIYTTPSVREPVFAILEQLMESCTDEEGTTPVNLNTGRPGMSQWQILVLGVLRLGLNADYDRIQELANEHSTLRKMLGHSDWADEKRYELQTLKDNLRHLTPEVLDQINQEVVRAGHKALKKSSEEGLVARVDSFVVETNVHFPTDINLLLDAIRKTIDTCVQMSNLSLLEGWRQHTYHQRQFKKRYRKIQRLKHSTSKDPVKQKRKAEEIQQAHRDYLALARNHLDRAEQTRQQFSSLQPTAVLLLLELDNYRTHAQRQIEQIERRVLQGERIPHEEKIFSIFEPHTEWICKGKAGVPVELGLRVNIIEDRDRFILHHQVMEKCTDDQVAVSAVDETKERFALLRAVSMDKGYHSPSNQEALKERLDCIVLPKKGRRSQADKARETQEEFIQLRKEHSAVESAINALEQHGLDKCPDHGIDGFKRYVALAVVARNIQRLGAVLQQQVKDKEQRKRGVYRKQAA